MVTRTNAEWVLFIIMLDDEGNVKDKMDIFMDKHKIIDFLGFGNSQKSSLFAMNITLGRLILSTPGR